MPPPYFPLRWESTGDEWWYAAPIDWAAANGLYDLVIQMLRLDDSLLTKLTSLRRIRRLETLWDDQTHFGEVAKCRSHVARRLLHETKDSLMRTGLGGWFLYTAASAGDLNFVKDLLDRDPLLVFGEGEYGVTDIFYAAARSKNSEVFRLLFEFVVSSTGCADGEEGLGFNREMMNRAAHAAARGGNVEILREIIADSGGDALVFRDAQGSTVLHAASGRGQVEVVQDLVSSYDIITSTDDLGNTALHMAAYRGHLSVVELLAHASPTSAYAVNNHGETFLHLAVAGFQTPGFRRVDRQLELMKQLLNGKILDIRGIINLKDKGGRTALHVAVTGNIQSTLVELLILVPWIDLNACDSHGMTPLDLLKQLPRSAATEIVMKKLIAAGGISNCEDGAARSAVVSDLKWQAICGSPGTSFRIPDAEIFLYTSTDDASNVRHDPESTEYSCTCLSEISDFDFGNSWDENDRDSVTYASRHLKLLFQWTRKKQIKAGRTGLADDGPLQLINASRSWAHRHVPLRLLYSNSSFSSLPSNKRLLITSSNLPSPSGRQRFSSASFHTPSSSISGSSMALPISMDNQEGVKLGVPRQHYLNQSSNGKAKEMNQKQASLNKRLMNKYLCFGAKGLAVEDAVSCRRQTRSFKRVNSLVTSVSSELDFMTF